MNVSFKGYILLKISVRCKFYFDMFYSFFSTPERRGGEVMPGIGNGFMGDSVASFS